MSIRPLFAAVVASLAFAFPSLADVALPPVFSDHAVVQRGVVLPVWGTAAPGEAVTVTLAGQTQQTTADAAGNWRVDFQPIEAVGPHEMTVTGANGQPITLANLLAGEVWLLSGQSNMEWPVAASNNAEEEIAGASFPQIRLLTVTKAVAAEPRTAMTGKWEVCTPQTVGSFSAVGYFMGRQLHRELGVPIGLIDSSWGGTPIEAWMPADVLSSLGRGEQVAQAAERLKAFEAETAARVAPQGAQLAKTAADVAQWAKPEYNDNSWRRVALPGLLESEGGPDVDGVAWFRVRLRVPAERAGQPAVLSLGAIDDFDETYVNGQQVGATDMRTADHWQHRRTYQVPANVLKEGENVVAVRMTDSGGNGGFTGPVDEMFLEFVGDGDAAQRRILLAGEWRSAFEAVSAPNPTAAQFPAPQNEPTSLYNAMIRPLEPYAVRGFAWYQGESNAGQPEPYADLLKGMITTWRDRFEGDATPAFLIVQLANFQATSDDPGHTDGWAILRDRQRQAADEVEKAGLAVITDVGDAGDIHPRDKLAVGNRLAVLALREAYGRDVVAEGPRVVEVKTEGDALFVKFANAEGMAITGDAAKAFSIAGADGAFAWATAAIEGDTIRLTAPGVTAPTHVRHAWSINPNATLHNAQGLVAPGFDMAAN